MEEDIKTIEELRMIALSLFQDKELSGKIDVYESLERAGNIQQNIIAREKNSILKEKNKILKELSDNIAIFAKVCMDFKTEPIQTKTKPEKTNNVIEPMLIAEPKTFSELQKEQNKDKKLKTKNSQKNEKTENNEIGSLDNQDAKN